MPKRSRDKQLAKLAQRRQAERRAAKRRRDLTIGLVAGGIALILVAVGAFILFGGDDQTGAASPSASVAPGTQTGTVTPEAPAPETVACGGKVPPKADKPKPQFAGPPPLTIDPSHTYTATIETSCGTIEAELLAKTATEGVNSFVFLAQQGFYDGQTFHRIAKDFVIQGGDPLGTGTGGPGYEFPVTTTEGVSFDGPGVLAYAHGQTGGNGSQFFFTLAAAPNLDPPNGQYTIFGSVTKGQDVLDAIAAVPTTAGPSGEPSQPTEAVYINSVTIDGA
jgi:cyclophilin family peptidyl-prolyl cis-trans isomerase